MENKTLAVRVQVIEAGLYMWNLLDNAHYDTCTILLFFWHCLPHTVHIQKLIEAPPPQCIVAIHQALHMIQDSLRNLSNADYYSVYTCFVHLSQPP